MGKWAALLKSLSEQTPSTVTAITARTPVSEVLAVRSDLTLTELPEVVGVSSVPSKGVCANSQSMLHVDRADAAESESQEQLAQARAMDEQAIVASTQDWAKAQVHGGDRRGDQVATLPLETIATRAAESGASLRTQKMADKVATAPVGDPASIAGQWDDRTIARFCDRRDRFIAWGYTVADAERHAERLARRDAEGDPRRMCATECRFFRYGRCANHQQAGLGSQTLGLELAAMLQRCPGFGARS